MPNDNIVCMEAKKVDRYVSFEAVLGYYNIISQETYSDTCAVRQSAKTESLDSQIDRILPDNLFFGYRPMEIGKKTHYVADPEKAFLDLVYYKTSKNEPVDFEQFDLSLLSHSKLEEYAQKMGFEYKLIIGQYLKKHPVPSQFGYKIPKELAA